MQLLRKHASSHFIEFIRRFGEKILTTLRSQRPSHPGLGGGFVLGQHKLVAAMEELAEAASARKRGGITRGLGCACSGRPPCGGGITTAGGGITTAGGGFCRFRDVREEEACPMFGA